MVPNMVTGRIANRTGRELIVDPRAAPSSRSAGLDDLRADKDGGVDPRSPALSRMPPLDARRGGSPFDRNADGRSGRGARRRRPRRTRAAEREGAPDLRPCDGRWVPASARARDSQQRRPCRTTACCRPPCSPRPAPALDWPFATSRNDLAHKLRRAVSMLAANERRKIRDRSGIYYTQDPLGGGRLAVLFPGEGAQSSNMLADVCVAFPEARAWFDLLDRAFVGHDRRPLPSHVVIPPPGQGQEERLWEMDFGAEAVFTANQALWSVLSRLGLRADGFAGHSTGEYSALLASGALRVAEEREFIARLLEIHDVYRRAAERGFIPQAELVAVGGIDRAAVTELLAEYGDSVFLAMDNCPQQMVLCGNGALASAINRLREQGAVCLPMPATA